MNFIVSPLHPLPRLKIKTAWRGNFTALGFSSRKQGCILSLLKGKLFLQRALLRATRGRGGEVFVIGAPQPTRKRMSRMVLPPKRCFSFRRISNFEICSSS
jgi:hypothetical protein